MSVPAGQMGGLSSRPVLSRGSEGAKALLARLWAAANLGGEPSADPTRAQQAGLFGAGPSVFGFGGPRLSSHLMRLGFLSPGARPFRGVTATPEQIQASYALGGGPLSSMAATPGQNTWLGDPAGAPQAPMASVPAGFSVAPGQDPAPSFSSMQGAGVFGPMMPVSPMASVFRRDRPPARFASWAEAMAHGQGPYRR